MIGYVRIEGDSFAQGQGDEVHKGGFAGRLSTICEAYTEEAKRLFLSEGTDIDCRAVMVAPKGEGGNFLPIMAKTLAKAGVEAPLAEQTTHTIHKMGIFVVGYSPFSWYNEGISTTDAVDNWRNSLDLVQAVTERDDITALVINEPQPPKSAKWGNGKLIDGSSRELFRKLTAVTQKHAGQWAEFCTFEDIWRTKGTTTAECMTNNDIHPNAHGYQLVASFLRDELIRTFGLKDELLPHPEHK